MPYPAALIAYAFVKRGIDEGTPITQMKLQKLVFFAHGIHLAQYGRPLIEEKFQAWKFGPVVRDIYSAYRFYGSEPISDTVWLFVTNNLDEALESLPDDVKGTINFTWDNLKNFNASQLSNWTHKDGSPWQKFYVEGIKDVDIPNDEIKTYFKRFLVK